MQGEVLLQLLLQAVVDMTGGHKLTLLAEEGRVVNLEKHRHGRFVDGNRWQGLWILDIADGIANLEVLQSDHCADVAAIYLVDTAMSHAVEGMELLDLGLLHRTVTMGNGYLHAVLQLTAMYTAHGDTACVGAIVQRGNQHLGRTLNLLGSRNHLQNLVQQIGDVCCGLVIVLTHPTVLGRAIDHGEVQLVFGGIQREHQVEHHLIHLFRTTVGLVHLVHHHDRLQSNLQSLLQHETGLGHRALESVHQQQTAVCHIQHALHLAAEVGVSRGVDDIDFCSFPVNTNIL